MSESEKAILEIKHTIEAIDKSLRHGEYFAVRENEENLKCVKDTLEEIAVRQRNDVVGEGTRKHIANISNRLDGLSLWLPIVLLLILWRVW